MKLIRQFSPFACYASVLGHSILGGILLTDTWNRGFLQGEETEFRTHTRKCTIIKFVRLIVYGLDNRRANQRLLIER